MASYYPLYLATSIATRLRRWVATDCPHYYHFVEANAAGSGAQLALLSDLSRNAAETIAANTKHLSLAGMAEFQKIYLAAMGFPTEVNK
ncbi:MAG: ATP-binding protein [Gammaproteobacteria bacterium]|nr:ATP-binding protein [Gammaproteobacteria bacterium]